MTQNINKTYSQNIFVHFFDSNMLKLNLSWVRLVKQNRLGVLLIQILLSLSE